MDKTGIPLEARELVDAAIAKARINGVIKADAQAIVAAVAKQFQSGRPPRDVSAYTYFLAENLNPAPLPGIPTDFASREELAVLEGRCFCWPIDRPTNFVQILQDGRYVQHIAGEDPSKLRHGHLAQGKLLEAIRAGQLLEIAPDAFASLIQRGQP